MYMHDFREHILALILCIRAYLWRGNQMVHLSRLLLTWVRLS